ncbi:uncharacterized protein [Amphiura filiformis]|uniref:uncharacterized protein n=1 Tax=Amphiura filiformis TaxID=82378 RepID=UPI003B21CC64
MMLLLFIISICSYSTLLSICGAVTSINNSWEVEELVDADNCPPNYNYFSKSCYQLNTARVQRSEASATCRKANAHLVDITSQSEQNFVADLLENNPEIQRLKDIHIAENVGAWIGLMVSDRTPSRELVWSDGTSLGFTAWDPVRGRNEPQVDCVRMDSEFQFKWGDRDCRLRYSFVCEKSSEIGSSLTPSVLTHVPTNRGAALTAPVTSAVNINNSTGYPDYHHELTIIEICYPIFTVVVAVAVGVLVYCCYLRKKLKTSVPVGPNLKVHSRHEEEPAARTKQLMSEQATKVTITLSLNQTPSKHGSRTCNLLCKTILYHMI